MAEKLVMDEMYEIASKSKWMGKRVLGAPSELSMILDFTGPRGSGSNIYYSYIFQLPTWDFQVKKVDEWIEVTPEFREFYEITIEQKQKLESAIKTGLTSAGQAVADYELLSHDARRYREILDYFKHAAKTGDEHVLRNIFVDRVDMNTGDFAIINMVKRWPSLISDFIRMKPDLTEVDKIRKDLDVSTAEASILKTKNELYKEWKALFAPAIKERYARIITMTNARKKSVDEYKNWLKPYIARYRMIREKTESKPSTFVSSPYMTPGFGQSQASTGVRLWTWNGFSPAEKGRPEYILEKKYGDFILDPYDDFVKEWKKKIEDHYMVKFTHKDIRDLIKEAVKKNEMNPARLYYVMFDIKINLNLGRVPPPAGMEIDNIIFNPIKIWVMSQNVLLVHLIEIKAREEAFDKYVNEIVGSKEFEEQELARIEEEFSGKSERRSRLRSSVVRGRGFGSMIRRALTRIFHVLVKEGPYEVNFEERLTKQYFRAAGGMWGAHINHIKKAMQIE